MATQYFSKATFKFQRDLARNNNRAWFAANKERYEDVLKQPFLRFIEDMQKPLAKRTKKGLRNLSRITPPRLRKRRRTFARLAAYTRSPGARA